MHYVFIFLYRKKENNRKIDYHMQKFTNIDFMYPAFMLIFSLVMIFSPRTMMGRAKYDEESLRTESWIKKLGIGFGVFALAFAIFIYFNLKDA